MNTMNQNAEPTAVSNAVSATGAQASQFNNRPCSFDPTKFLINLEHDPQKAPRLYLTVNMRVHWFQTWCRENGKRFLIAEGKAERIPETSLIQCECTVYIDGEPAGIGVGGFNLAGQKDPETCVQTCQTIAKGRALANAGFGSVFAGTDANENGAGTPCDAGVNTDFFVFRPQQIGPNAGNPMAAPASMPQAAPVPTQQAQPQTKPQAPQNAPYAAPPVHQVTQVPKTENAPKTREEALQFTVNMKGVWFGHPLAEVLAKSPKDVEFFARCRIADLKTAAQLVLNKI